MEQNEPTTGEIVRALRACIGIKITCKECMYHSRDNANCLDRMLTETSDRLERQEAKLKLLNGGDFDVIDVPAALAYLESVEEILPHASALIDLIQSIHSSAKELTARAESAERERDAARRNNPWVRIEGRDYFAQVKRFDPANNMVVIADHEFGWHSVRYDQIREWRGRPQEGEGK